MRDGVGTPPTIPAPPGIYATNMQLAPSLARVHIVIVCGPVIIGVMMIFKGVGINP